MSKTKIILLVVTAIIFCGGCTNTRYLTDPTSVERQRDMRSNRVGKNIGEGCLNISFFILAAVLNSEFVPVESERSFKRISVINQSTDSLFVNMVTDIVWKENGYCDIMGIVLPPGAKQKLLVPYPAAYNVYFQSPFTEEEKIEVWTDSKLRQIKLRTGMTQIDSLKTE
jgi:hypothetical protein